VSMIVIGTGPGLVDSDHTTAIGPALSRTERVSVAGCTTPRNTTEYAWTVLCVTRAGCMRWEYRCPTGRAVPSRAVVPDGPCLWRTRAWPPAQEHGVPRAAREQRTGRKLMFGVMERGWDEQRRLGEWEWEEVRV
jgi:hypothetical protein